MLKIHFIICKLYLKIDFLKQYITHPIEGLKFNSDDTNGENLAQ